MACENHTDPFASLQGMAFPAGTHFFVSKDEPTRFRVTFPCGCAWELNVLVGHNEHGMSVNEVPEKMNFEQLADYGEHAKLWGITGVKVDE